MHLIEKADKFLEKFVYKKHIKIEIYCLLYNIGLCLSLFLFDNFLLYRTISVTLIIGNIYSILFETLRYTTVNDSTYAKFKIIYSINLILFIIFPYNSFIIIGFFIIPYSIYFLNLADHYLGVDNLHWPYILHLLYGEILFCLAFIIKKYVDIFNNCPLNPNTLIFLQPFTLAIAVNVVATDLVDLRFIFKAKSYRDYIASCYDILTEIPGRGGLFKIFGEHKIKAIAMIDIDFFKKINDTYGHDAGDAVLKQIANKLYSLTKDTLDVFACRWGGEEFVIAGTSYEIVRFACVELLKDLRTNPVKITDDVSLIKTLSCGIAKKRDDESVDALICRADDQCYLAKEKGRNQIRYDNKELLC